MGIFPRILKEVAVLNGLMISIVHEFSYLKSSFSIQSSFKYLSCQWCLYYGIPLAYVFACMGHILQNVSVSLRIVDIVGNIFERKKMYVFAPFTHCGKARNFLSQKNSWIQLFSNFFSIPVDFTKFLSKKCERNFLQFPQCGITRNSLSLNFFVKSTL